MNRKRWYPLISLAVVMAFVITGISIQIARKSEKEKTLIYQLQELRQVVRIYVQVHHQIPPSLPVALDAQYSFGHPFQWKFARDALGMPLDPFGNSFQYDTSTGWARSKTLGYEEW